MLVALLAALMSTADICILTATANLSHDVYKRYVNPDVEPRRIFRLSMGLSVLIGAVAALMAWGMQDIINILLVAFTINSAALFLPTLGAIYRLPLSREAAFWSMTLSLATVIGWYFAAMLDLAPLFEIDPLWPGLAVSLAVIVAGTVFTAGESLLVSRPGDGRNK
jgi:SSS family solute:Na+ symporter